MMKRFKATVVSGHKQDAVEVPFDPCIAWTSRRVAIEPGRRGIAVTAKIKNFAFDSFVVARSKRFWLLLPPDLEQTAGISEGDEVSVVVSLRKSRDD